MAALRSLAHVVVASAAFLSLGACVGGIDVDARKYACAKDADCGAGWKCVGGVCGGASTDAGSTAPRLIVGNCPAPPTCGGVLLGTWPVREVCVDELNPVSGLLPTIETCGAVSWKGLTGTTSGSATFGATTANVSLQANLSGTLVVAPDYCNCSTIASYIRSKLGPSTQCSLVGANCECPFTVRETIAATGASSFDAGTVTVPDSSSMDVVLAYCLGGSSATVARTDDNKTLNTTWTLAAP